MSTNNTNLTDAINAGLNAMRIAREMPDTHPVLSHSNMPTSAAHAVAHGAALMAQIEGVRGFFWNDRGNADWETACARVAEAIAKGRLINKRTVRAMMREKY